MRVFAVTHRVPYPPNKGEKIRSHGLLVPLASKHEVHLFALAEPASDVAHERALLDAGFASVTLAPIDLRLRKAVSALFVATPLPLTLPAFFSPTLAAKIALAARSAKPDVAVLESSSTLPYAEMLPRNVRWLMDLVDVDSAKWDAYAKGDGSVTEHARAIVHVVAEAKRLVFRREGATLAAVERRIVSRAFATLVTTEREAALLRDVCRSGARGETSGRIEVVPNGVDTVKFAPVTPPAHDARPRRIVFFGAMDYDANVDAARWFADAVLPRVRERAPDVVFVIAGSNPAPEVRSLARTGEIEVTGFLEDIRPTVQSALVCVAPLRVARGVQNKILEAMAMGVPVVTTVAAAGGVEGHTPESLRVAEDASAMAEAVLALLADEGARTRQAAAARELVVARYGWAPRAAKLELLLEEAAAASRA